MGARVITEVSNIMFEKFSQNFQALLQQSADQPAVASAAVTPPEPIQPGSIAWQAIKGMFRSLLQALKGLFSAKA
jgi:hypothetical protein